MSIRLTTIRILSSAQVLILGLSFLLPHAAWGQTGMPDLVFDAGVADPFIIDRTFEPSECPVVKGCALDGTRTLLQWTQEIHNIGDADLVLGPPRPPLYEFDFCFGTHVLEDWYDYRLMGPTGLVATGFKPGFCVTDVAPFDPAANEQRRFNCDFQGIQAGWADVYSPGFDCQWIDVTDVPDGAYTLELEVNAARTIVESDYTNNVVSIPVMIGNITTSTTMPLSVCADPARDGITASDALAVLRAAVGLDLCEACVCDADGSGILSATDSLIALRAATGIQVELNCPPCA